MNDSGLVETGFGHAESDPNAESARRSVETFAASVIKTALTNKIQPHPDQLDNPFWVKHWDRLHIPGEPLKAVKEQACNELVEALQSLRTDHPAISRLRELFGITIEHPPLTKADLMELTGGRPTPWQLQKMGPEEAAKRAEQAKRDKEARADPHVAEAAEAIRQAEAKTAASPTPENGKNGNGTNGNKGPESPRDQEKAKKATQLQERTEAARQKFIEGSRQEWLNTFWKQHEKNVDINETRRSALRFGLNQIAIFATTDFPKEVADKIDIQSLRHSVCTDLGEILLQNLVDTPIPTERTHYSIPDSGLNVFLENLQRGPQEKSLVSLILQEVYRAGDNKVGSGKLFSSDEVRTKAIRYALLRAVYPDRTAEPGSFVAKRKAALEHLAKWVISATEEFSPK